MGGALSVGAGAFVAGKNVLVCGGDAEFVMHMGGLTTLGRYQGNTDCGRLIYLLFDNQANKSTGGQCTYQKHVDYQAIAAASGLTRLGEFDNVDGFRQQLKDWEAVSGQATFALIRCAFDPDMPRPPMDAVVDSKYSFDA
jgi:phosphonopyruvate decarboxylase